MSEQAPKGFKTREEGLQHLIQIATAFLEKKPVQIFNTHNSRWDDCYGWCDLSAEPHIFRVKPEPREWWEVRTVGANRIVDTFSFLPAAKEWMKNYNDEPVRLFKVTEVIE